MDDRFGCGVAKRKEAANRPLRVGEKTAKQTHVKEKLLISVGVSEFAFDDDAEASLNVEHENVGSCFVDLVVKGILEPPVGADRERGVGFAQALTERLLETESCTGVCPGDGG